jgi:hypothetical protein
MKRVCTSVLLSALFVSVLFLSVSCTKEELRRVGKVLEAQAPQIVETIARAYGDSYGDLAKSLFAALQTPGGSSPSGYDTSGAYPTEGSGTYGSYPPSGSYGASGSYPSGGSGASGSYPSGAYGPSGGSGTSDSYPSPAYGQTLEVYFDVVREAPGGYQPETVWDGDTMTYRDNYKVVFQSNIPCYLYIAQVDSTGKVDPIFPSGYASGGNPVQPYTSYSVPGGTEWFYLDNNVGVETIYVMASRQRRNDLEEILGQFEYRNQSLVQQQQVQMNQYYSLMRGIGGVRQGGATQQVQYQDGTQGQYAATAFSSVQAEFVATRWFNHQRDTGGGQ